MVDNADLSLIPVRFNGKYGYINPKGEYVINPQFEWADFFSEGLAPVRIDGKHGFIDKKGQIAINPQFEWVDFFSEGLAPVKIGDKWGFIDKKGKIVINPLFEWADPFSEGLASVMIGDKWGFIDKKGKIVINPLFDWVYSRTQMSTNEIDVCIDVYIDGVYVKRIMSINHAKGHHVLDVQKTLDCNETLYTCRWEDVNGTLLSTNYWIEDNFQTTTTLICRLTTK
jgi:hypothetical protein